MIPNITMITIATIVVVHLNLDNNLLHFNIQINLDYLLILLHSQIPL